MLLIIALFSDCVNMGTHHVTFSFTLVYKDFKSWFFYVTWELYWVQSVKINTEFEWKFNKCEWTVLGAVSLNGASICWGRFKSQINWTSIITRYLLNFLLNWSLASQPFLVYWLSFVNGFEKEVNPSYLSQNWSLDQWGNFLYGSFPQQDCGCWSSSSFVIVPDVLVAGLRDFNSYSGVEFNSWTLQWNLTLYIFIWRYYTWMDLSLTDLITKLYLSCLFVMACQTMLAGMKLFITRTQNSKEKRSFGVEILFLWSWYHHSYSVIKLVDLPYVNGPLAGQPKYQP